MNIDNQSGLIYSLIFVIIVLIVFVAILIFSKRNTNQRSSGNQSPNIKNENGKVIVNYGVSEETLLRIMNEKNIAIEERNEWKQKYRELEEGISKRNDDYAKQIENKLSIGDLSGAEELLLKSLEQNLKTLNNVQENAAADAFELGKLKELQLDYYKAKDYYEQAVQLDKQNIEYLHQLGGILYELGQYSEALEYFQQVLNKNLIIYGEEHPNIAEVYTHIGGAWENLGYPQKAIDEYYKKALDIDLAAYGDNHPEVAKDYNNIGLALDSENNLQRDSQKAIEYYQKDLDIILPIFGEQHLQVATTYNNIGLAWRHLNNFQKAIEYYERALSIDLLYNKEHPQIALRYNNIGMAWNNPNNPQRNPKKALENLQKALNMYQQFYKDDHINITHIKNTITEILLKK